MKGLPLAAYATDAVVYIHFTSPTGGTTDSHVLTMPCLSDTQANEIVSFYRNTFNIPDWSKV